ncbi:hypothetical protein KZZ07_01505 [Mameliella sp. CS4]|uniref:hypothetical protein n=1 Tax=Mameliella sp. CS4 TaxID=2862329 RepID=UPI001C5DC0B1|nr:hypothetical protein [Mameliella sp. CS4]MBW4981203.1 hypothetical protein [Mameliella sp. CS4]
MRFVVELGLIGGIFLAISFGWDRVVDWIDPAPHWLNLVELPGPILLFVFAYAAGRWLRARDRKK